MEPHQTGMAGTGIVGACAAPYEHDHTIDREIRPNPWPFGRVYNVQY